MGSTTSESLSNLSARFSALVSRLAGAMSDPSSHKGVLIAALVALGVIVIFLVAAIAFLPSKRKVVRKRRVRRVRRKVADKPQAEDSKRTASKVVSPGAVKARRRLNLAAWILAWAVLVALAFVVAYRATGTDQYCGHSCHASDPHVVVAVQKHHADCVACHESDPVSGIVARARMALAGKGAIDSVTALPVDSQRCLSCHRDVTRATLKTKAGLAVSHKEILSGGRTCRDCHLNVGHVKGTSISGGMSACTSCHDGRAASRECQTCHFGGSPLAVADAKTKANSAYDYGPAIRVANRDCARCHGAETECRACHNGLVLPHPVEFIKGGHARLAAFNGKQICVKCHTLVWCGDDTCHHGFSAHDPTTWRVAHRTGTSAQCGSCHMSWDGKGDFCRVCH